jgi:glycosyltransferase involved in cell wall biosynthesis
MEIMHIPTTVGGHPQGLSRAERLLGHNSVAISLYQNYIGYNTDVVLHDPTHSALRIFRDRLNLLRRLCAEPEVVHFNFGSSLLPNRSPCKPKDPFLKRFQKIVYNTTAGYFCELLDLKLIARANKVVAVTFQGDDARQGDYCRANFPIHFAHEVDKGYYSDKDDRWKRKRIEVFDRHADIIYALNPDLMHVLPKRTKFLPYANIDPKKIEPVGLHSNSREILHIVHAPTHRQVKGTSYIIDALNRLKAEGLPFRYTLVEGLSHTEAMEIYRTADILVDQLLAGFYGGLAVEAMCMGIPVVAYIRKEDLKFVPEKMRESMPIISASPNDIYSVLKRLLTGPKEYLVRMGIASRRYAERWHDPDQVALETTSDYRRALAQKSKAFKNYALPQEKADIHESY